ncbi:hypothetical protein NQZ68_014262 [Dissostichus eleginoides]|nr:hypothetical protein NQZ68_014262 [Dissostichus eleginoides]
MVRCSPSCCKLQAKEVRRRSQSCCKQQAYRVRSCASSDGVLHIPCGRQASSDGVLRFPCGRQASSDSVLRILCGRQASSDCLLLSCWNTGFSNTEALVFDMALGFVCQSEGVLQKSEFGAAGVVPVVVQTAGLTFGQQKELLAMQFEQEKLRAVLQRSVLGVIGDVEKMVAIPAVVQSFHQAPPVDLQVRGNPRAPEWASVIIAEERVIGRISVRCWNLRGSLVFRHMLQPCVVLQFWLKSRRV